MNTSIAQLLGSGTTTNASGTASFSMTLDYEGGVGAFADASSSRLTLADGSSVHFYAHARTEDDWTYVWWGLDLPFGSPTWMDSDVFDISSPRSGADYTFEYNDSFLTEIWLDWSFDNDQILGVGNWRFTTTEQQQVSARVTNFVPDTISTFPLLCTIICVLAWRKLFT